MGNRDKFSKADQPSAKPDEPVYLLRGRDRYAPKALRRWADALEKAMECGHEPSSRYDEAKRARRCARAMDVYREKEESNGNEEQSR